MLALCWSMAKCRLTADLWDTASWACPLTAFLHIIPYKRRLTWMIGSTGHVVIMTIGTGNKSLAGVTWLVVTIGHATTVRYTGARSRRWVTGAWRRRRRSCWWWWCWWASRALVLTTFLHIIPHKRWITGSTGHVVIMTIGTGYKSLAGFTWLVVTIGHATAVRYTGVSCRGPVAGGWRASGTICWWSDGGWWDRAGRALLYTLLFPIIPKITVFASNLTEQTIFAFNIGIAKFAWLV